MKKQINKMIIPMGLIVSMSISMTTPAFALSIATETEKNPVKIEENVSEEKIDNKYVHFEGKIKSIIVSEKITTITVEGASETQIFHIYEDTILFNAETQKEIKASELKENMEVMAAYSVMTPVALSFPPQINPEVLIVKPIDSNVNVKIDIFDKENLSSDKQLKINKSENTEIVDLKGNKITFEEITDKPVIVFYTVETKSLPPITNPEKIVLIEKKEVSKIIINRDDLKSRLDEKAIITKDNVTYLRLNDVAEALGTKLFWNKDNGMITFLYKNDSYLIKVGDLNYKKNLDGKKFVNAPIVDGERTYVEENFFSQLFK